MFLKIIYLNLFEYKLLQFLMKIYSIFAAEINLKRTTNKILNY